MMILTMYEILLCKDHTDLRTSYAIWGFMASVSLFIIGHMNKRNWFIFALVFAALVVTALVQDPINRSRLEFVVKGETAYVFGATDEWSLGTFKRFRKRNPDVKTLVLKGMSGTRDADTNIKIARLIREQGLDTHLDADSYIASGAVDLFLAGKNRTMACGAQIGVHAWQSQMGFSPRDVKWDTRQGYQERFLLDMGIDPEFYAFTRAAAPPEGIYVLSPDDINRFNLLSSPLKCISTEHI